MREPGTGRTSVMPEIWRGVNHKHHFAEIRISLKGFLVTSVLNQFGMGFTHTPEQETKDPCKDAILTRWTRCSLRHHRPPLPALPGPHLRPTNPLRWHAPLPALGASSPTGGACCAMATTVIRTKVRRLRISIVADANAAPRR